MISLIVFIGIMGALYGLAFNKKWYTKLAAVVGGLTIAAFPFKQAARH